MKILQINSVVNYGSTGRIAEEIGQTLIESGGESYIAYGRFPRESQSQTIRIGGNWNMRMHGLYTRIFDRHGLASGNATKKLIRQIDAIKPDIIHLHNLHGYYLNYKILFHYLAKINIPIVWTLHDCWAYTGHCSHYTYAQCNRWKEECYQCPNKKDYPQSLCIDRSKQNFRDKETAFCSVQKMVLVPVSNWLAGEVRQSFLQDYPIQVIHNGIDLDVFKPYPSVKEKYGIKDKFLILGVANIWSERKGLNDFINLSKQLPTDSVILLVGLSDKQLQQLPINIIGLKRTENVKELAELYASADVFVNPTWEDNFPTTNIEALACGTPVITYRTGGSVEAVTPETGFIVEQGDIAGLVNAIQTIKANKKRTYAQVCRERALSCFDKKDKYAEYIQLYKNIIGNDAFMRIP